MESERDKLTGQLGELNATIKGKDSRIAEQRTEIASLTKQIQELKAEIYNLKTQLEETKSQLQVTTEKYEEAKPYQERIESGQNIYQAYTLLSDYQDYTRPIILTYLGLSYPVRPSNDEELWERGRQVYQWLSSNYEYQGDKGLRIGDTFEQFQFYSPDELLMSDNARGGDCDDFAMLFAGMMYASGVPEDKVWLVCGTVENGGHCWDTIVMSNGNYRVDPVCSQKESVFSILGINILEVQGASYPSTKTNVVCFDEYSAQIRMNPSGYFLI
ncbi:MAG: transglutaminase domain-containing protein [Candidatus Woesearchaeota archaeon]